MWVVHKARSWIVTDTLVLAGHSPILFKGMILSEFIWKGPNRLIFFSAKWGDVINRRIVGFIHGVCNKRSVISSCLAASLFAYNISAPSACIFVSGNLSQGVPGKPPIYCVQPKQVYAWQSKIVRGAPITYVQSNMASKGYDKLHFKPITNDTSNCGEFFINPEYKNPIAGWFVVPWLTGSALSASSSPVHPVCYARTPWVTEEVP